MGIWFPVSWFILACSLTSADHKHPTVSKPEPPHQKNASDTASMLPQPFHDGPAKPLMPHHFSLQPVFGDVQEGFSGGVAPVALHPAASFRSGSSTQCGPCAGTRVRRAGQPKV
ncbi:hypothetical protein MCA0658 [Methylococcus capsulatus str. Bath]|uniref:Uncharacterized protein n=1 Tax=Methylococcus capsulatus (strain ATCC 33009 / NCIMB 11132 / Bath) TaxID=243233 RepID=Q60B26_METCA|nr:hypothetical protein MCA0658 [Methylococcus capsulatus str. Bath]